jgi:hypothetical protein
MAKLVISTLEKNVRINSPAITTRTTMAVKMPMTGKNSIPDARSQVLDFEVGVKDGVDVDSSDMT